MCKSHWKVCFIFIKENAKASVMWLCWCSAHTQYGLGILGCSGCLLTVATGFLSNKKLPYCSDLPTEPLSPMISFLLNHAQKQQGGSASWMPTWKSAWTCSKVTGKLLRYSVFLSVLVSFWILNPMTEKLVQASNLSITLNKILTQKETIKI